MEVIPYRESPFCLLHSFTAPAAEAGGESGGVSFASESRFRYPASRSFGYRKGPEKGEGEGEGELPHNYYSARRRGTLSSGREVGRCLALKLWG